MNHSQHSTFMELSVSNIAYNSLGKKKIRLHWSNLDLGSKWSNKKRMTEEAIGPGEKETNSISNLPFELRRKAGDCSRVTAGPIDLI